MLDHGIPKLNESTHSFKIIFQSSFEGISHIFFMIHSPGLFVLIVLHQFLHQHADVIFHNFLELHSTLPESETRFFHECSFY